MDDDNKYHWTFRQTVGVGYTGEPKYSRCSFGSIYDLVRSIIFSKKEEIKRAIKNGWGDRFILK